MFAEKPGTVLYCVVKDKIIEMIKSGKYAVDKQLPTESDFCSYFNVSRTTVRLALQQLVLEGRIYRVQGRGTFVSKPKIQQSATSVKSFAEQMMEQGLHPQSKVLELEVIPAHLSLAQTLQLEQNDPVNKLVRLRFADNEPLQYETSYIPWKYSPGLIHDDCHSSLFQLLRTKYNVAILRTEEFIEPILTDENISRHLNIPIGAPSFYVETITYTIKNIPIEYSQAIFRGDRSKFVIGRNYPS